MVKPHYPVLAMGRVRYVGEPVAMIVADTPEIAEDARELVEIEYRDLKAVTTFDDAVHSGAPQLHANVPGNLAFEFESGDEQAVAAAFARAKHVSRLTMDSQRLVGNAMEPRACLVAYDAASGRYTLYAPLQGVGGMVGQISHVSGVDKSRIVMATQDVGGSFGVRGPAYHEYFAAMIAARKLGRPVKWVGTRAEMFASDFHGRAMSLTGELAMDEDGRFLAIRFDDRCDLGAYGAAFGSFIATRNITITIGGVYRVPALYGPHAARVHQHGPRFGVPRRRSPGRRLRDRATGRLRSARARLRPDRAAAAQFHTARGDAVPDGERRGVRFGRFRGGDG
jgi:carbon-monoxide dehydrogenase large subunit